MQTQLNRLIDILSPLGIYSFNNSGLLYAELCAYAVGLEMLDNAIELLEREAFVHTAQSYGLALREFICERLVSETDTAKRRQMLNNKTAITANDFNLQGIENALISAGINATIVEQRENHSIFINCHSMIDTTISQQTAIALASNYIPAHLDATFDFRNFSWDLFEELDLDFDQFDAKDKTWNDIDATTFEP